MITGGVKATPDPTLFLCAHRRPRVYLLSSRDPPGAGGLEEEGEEEEEEEDGGRGGEEEGEGGGGQQAGEKGTSGFGGRLGKKRERKPRHSKHRPPLPARDAMNEPPNKLDAASLALLAKKGGGGEGVVPHSMGGGVGGGAAVAGGVGAAKPKGRPALGGGSKVCLATTMGEVWLQLFPGDAPKACENFLGLCKRGYFDRCQFFRCIKGFMVQTGDPDNTGMGGTSIWGREFEDECVPTRRFNIPGQLAMANAGPGTNGSQFFITTAACTHLDGKHTIFGRVLGGSDVIDQCVRTCMPLPPTLQPISHLPTLCSLAPLTRTPHHAPSNRISSVRTDKNDRPLGDIPRILSTRFE